MEKSKNIDSPLGEKKERGSSLPMVGSPSDAFSCRRFTLNYSSITISPLKASRTPWPARVRGSAERNDERETEVRVRTVAGAPGQTAS